MGVSEPLPRPEAELRELAEKRAREIGLEGAPWVDAAPEASRHLVHELRVHQIELEMQNEELQRAQAQVARAHARYFELYDQAPVGYFTLSAEGLILEGNLTAARMLGVAKDALPGRAFTGFVSPADQDAHYLQFRRFSQGGAAYASDLRLRREDGTEFWARLGVTGHGGPMAGGVTEDAEPRQAWVTLTDLTETKRAEAERVEALGLLSAGIAHDFNNLLGAMQGNLELYRMDHGQGAPGMDLLGVVQTQIERAATIVAQLLAYAGKGGAPLGTVELNQQAEECLRMLRVSLAQGATISLQAASGHLFMEGEAGQLQQVIMNLLLNAAEAVEPGRGQIILSTGAVVLQGDDLPPGLGPGAHVWVEVADNGSGIPDGVRGRIFDPFFTTKTTGRGLGLSAVRGIVERHKGAIQITSQEGQGTRFRLMFPAVSRGPERPTGERGESPPGDGSPPREEGTILVVDDEDVLRTVTSASLRRMGFTALEARDGEEALRILDQDRDRISLVLLDHCMPGLTGVETAQRIRQKGMGMPLILSSGFDRASVFKDHPSGAFADFLPKPYRYPTLQETIRRALARGRPGEKARTT